LIFGLHLLQHFFSGAFRTNDIALVLNEALANHGFVANSTNETFIMPSQLLKGNELCVAKSPLASNRLGASGATL